MKTLAKMVSGATLWVISAQAGPVLFNQTNLVSDVPGLAVTTDLHLVNPWGMAFSGSSPIWVSNQGTNTSTLYNGVGIAQALVVNTPTTAPPQGPTGIVFNPTSAEFGGETFLFANLNGTIDGWHGALGTNAEVDHTVTGAVFTGLALGNNGSDHLYVADFAQSQIRVFDTAFAQQNLNGSFTDPNLPGGYSPYNIQNMGGKLYVAYAQPGAGGAQTGAGKGIVDVFDTDGNFLQRLVDAGGQLNAPWGVALAPAGFGAFGGDILIGNFGDGTINAFDPTTGAFIGTVDGPDGNPLVNQGLWGIAFGNGANFTSTTTLYFNAGIGNGAAAETHGLLGAISSVPEPGDLWITLAGLGLCGVLARFGKRRTRY